MAERMAASPVNVPWHICNFCYQNLLKKYLKIDSGCRVVCRVGFCCCWFCSLPGATTAVQLPSARRCDGHTYSAFTEGTEMCRDLELQWILSPDTLPSQKIPLSLGNKSISQTGVSGSVRSPWLQATSECL